MPLFDPGIFDPGIFDVGNITVNVPAATITLTGPAPDIGTIRIVVPAASLTLSGQSPASAVLVPRALVTLSSVAPRTAYRVPAAVITTSAPVPTVRSGTVVQVPAATVYLGVQARVSYGASGLTPIRVYIGGIEVSDDVLWAVQTEEILGGTGSAQFIVHDASNTFDPTTHLEVFIDVRATGWPLFHGETMSPQFDIEPGRDYAAWTIPCRDYNAQLAERLMGAPDGGQFWRPDVFTPYIAVDPTAISAGTDRGTVQTWIRNYFRLPNGIVPDTGTYVGEYIDNAYLGAAANIMWLYTATTTLQSALEELASNAEVNVQFWLMPDDRFAWLQIVPWQTLTAGGSQGDLPSAPNELGGEGIAIRLRMTGTKDGSSQPQALYVQGATGYTISDDATVVVAGGSGWYPSAPATTMRQAYLSSPQSWTEERRDRIADAAWRRSLAPTFRGSLTVIEENMGGFRAGQVVTVTDHRLPESVSSGFVLGGVPGDGFADLTWATSGRYVIQRVQTSLLPGSTHLSTVLDFGDGPVSRISGATRNTISDHAAEIAERAKPIVADLFVDFADISPTKAGDRRRFTVTPQNELAAYWKLEGSLINFAVTVYDADTEAIVLTSDASVSPSSAAADRDGRARGELVCDSARDDLKYEVSAYITVVPA